MNERLHAPPSDLTKVPPVPLRILIAAILSLGAWGAVSLVDSAVDIVQRDAEARAPKPPPPLPGEALPEPGRLFVFFCDCIQTVCTRVM